MKLYTFFILAVLSSLPSIFSALLEDSLFWSYFPRFRVSAQRPRGLFDYAFFFSGTFPASEYLRSASRSLERLFDDAFLAALSPLLSICAAPSRSLGGLFILDVLFPLSRVPAQLVQISVI